jgi:predicted outer membrane repeat protein
VRDARLHVIDVEFRNNAAASPGPDVGGGAIYATGLARRHRGRLALRRQHRFERGAVGLLQTNGRFVNKRVRRERVRPASA